MINFTTVNHVFTLLEKMRDFSLFQIGLNLPDPIQQVVTEEKVNAPDIHKLVMQFHLFYQKLLGTHCYLYVAEAKERLKLSILIGRN